MVTKLAEDYDIAPIYEKDDKLPVPIREEKVISQQTQVGINWSDFVDWVYVPNRITEFRNYLGQNGATEIRIPLSSLGFDP